MIPMRSGVGVSRVLPASNQAAQMRSSARVFAGEHFPFGGGGETVLERPVGSDRPGTSRVGRV